MQSKSRSFHGGSPEADIKTAGTRILHASKVKSMTITLTFDENDFDHRYSDDLDLFVNNDSAYDEHVARIFAALEMSQRRADLRIRYPNVLELSLSERKWTFSR
jgi:hypothetical protein